VSPLPPGFEREHAHIGLESGHGCRHPTAVTRNDSRGSEVRQGHERSARIAGRAPGSRDMRVSRRSQVSQISSARRAWQRLGHLRFVRPAVHDDVDHADGRRLVIETSPSSLYLRGSRPPPVRRRADRNPYRTDGASRSRSARAITAARTASTVAAMSRPRPSHPQSRATSRTRSRTHAPRPRNERARLPVRSSQGLRAAIVSVDRRGLAR